MTATTARRRLIIRRVKPAPSRGSLAADISAPKLCQLQNTLGRTTRQESAERSARALGVALARQSGNGALAAKEDIRE
jgi:hypothetical protein